MTDQTPQEGELILYRSADNAVRVEVLYESETFWLDQRRMAELFGVDVRAVSEHLRNVYASGELAEEATFRKIRMVRAQEKREVALANAGRVSAEVARRLAEEHYEQFRVRQERDFESDFEAEVKRIESQRAHKRKESP